MNYSIGGTANNGTDFVTLSGQVTVLAGQTSANISLEVIDDAFAENTETVILTLTGTDNASISVDEDFDLASNLIVDDSDSATVSIEATTDAAGEPSTDGQFTVTLSAVTDTDTVVNYSIDGTANNGTDYATLSGTVTVLAGETTAFIDVVVSDDAFAENTESVELTLTGTSNASITVDGTADTATVNIADDADAATVSIAANVPNADEDGTDGQFTVTLDSATDRDTVVSYSIGGVAANGTDFTTLSGEVTVLAGQTSAVIDVAVLEDAFAENSETVELTLTGTDNASITVDGSANEATVTIADDEDAATVSITTIPIPAEEPGTDTVLSLIHI